MKNGYILLWRKIKDTSFYKKPDCCHLAIHLLLNANHKNKSIVFNKQEMTVARGQLITGRFTLSQDSGLTQRKVRTALKTLANVGFLTSKTTNRFTIITILKYDEYQKSDQQIDQQVTSKRPADDQQMTTNKNVKNVKNNIPRVQKTITSKTGLIPCTEDELKVIAAELNISLQDVVRTHEIIKNKIASGEFKNKTVFYSLKNWLIMGLQRKTIIQKTDLLSGYKRI